MIGAISSLFLICVYLIYEIKSYAIDAILNALIVISGTFTIYRAISIMIDNSNVLGKICIGTSCVVFLSPIQL